MAVASTDPKIRIVRALERWGATVRRVALEHGKVMVGQWAYDGNVAHLGELAEVVAEIGVDAAIGAERDVSCQVTAYTESGEVVGSLPVKFPLPRAVVDPDEKEGTSHKLIALLLRHNEGLYQRLLGLSEQQATGLSGALAAQGRVLDALSDRLHKTEQLLQKSLERENESHSIAREAVALADQLANQNPVNGYKQTLEKVGATVELMEKAGKILGLQKEIDAAKGAAKELLNGAAVETPAPTAAPAPTQATPSDGGGQ